MIDGDGTLLYEAQPAERRVVSEQTAAAMLAMMASVFEGGKQNGTASTIVVPGFRCAGKTGTANKYDPAIHAYALDHYMASFAGLAPLDHPRLAIVVLVDDPTGGDHFGGTVAGPVFARVASEALRYLGVPGEPAVCAPAPATAGASAAVASSAAKTCLPAPPVPAARPRPAGSAGATARPGTPGPDAPAAAAPAAARPGAPGPDAPAAAASAAGDAEPWLAPAFAPIAPVAAIRSPRSAGSSIAVPALQIPDFRGMGMAHALAVAHDAHLSVALSGTGRVQEQQPPPGPSHAAPQVWLRLADGTAAVAPPP